jgi:predicted DCC family thiol-disulfide oxidoreductase YuxK
MGWVLYDGECALCRRWVDRFHALLLRHGLHCAPLQASWVRAKLGPGEELLTEMRLLTPAGRVFGGADALIKITRSIWWAWPFYVAAQLPGVKLSCRAIYRWLARNRHCLGNRCRLPNQCKKHPARGSITGAFYELP